MASERPFPTEEERQHLLDHPDPYEHLRGKQPTVPAAETDREQAEYIATHGLYLSEPSVGRLVEVLVRTFAAVRADERREVWAEAAEMVDNFFDPNGIAVTQWWTDLSGSMAARS